MIESQKRKRRRGAATVELMICLPVLLTVTFCVIDVCNYLHLQQKLSTIAFESVRFISRKGTTFNQAKSYGRTMGRARGVTRPVIEMEPVSSSAGTRNAMETGELIMARAYTVKIEKNMMGPFVLFHGAVVSSPVVVMAVQ